MTLGKDVFGVVSFCGINFLFYFLGINHGKCVTQNYRWMNKTGGWVYMQTVGTVLTRKNPKGGEESQILCVNYINRYEVHPLRTYVEFCVKLTEN